MDDTLTRAQVTARLSLLDGKILRSDELVELASIFDEFEIDPDYDPTLDGMTPEHQRRLELVSNAWGNYMVATSEIWGVYPGARWN